jgi:RNA polymerase sigma-70 factor (ECF subfamily)
MEVAEKGDRPLCPLALRTVEAMVYTRGQSGQPPFSATSAACATMAASPLMSGSQTAGPPTAMDAAGKLALFEQTVLPHVNAAYNLARWLTRNGDDADDVVQEAYLRAFRSFDTLQGQNSRAWLLAVVRNTCFSMLRKRGNQPAVEFDERMHSGADASPDAESVLLNRDALGSLQGCLEALPAEFREAIVLRELEELSYKEISEIARIPVGTVMSRLARARKRLQECMGGGRP